MTCSLSLSDEKSLRHKQNQNTKWVLLNVLWAPLNSFNMLVMPLLVAYKSFLSDNHTIPFVTSFILLFHCHILSETLSDQVSLPPSFLYQHSLSSFSAVFFYTALQLSPSNILYTYILLIYLFLVSLHLVERKFSDSRNLLLFLFFPVFSGLKTDLAVRDTQQILLNEWLKCQKSETIWNHEEEIISSWGDQEIFGKRLYF